MSLDNFQKMRETPYMEKSPDNDRRETYISNEMQHKIIL